MRLEIFIGASARRLLEEAPFLERWRELAALDAKFTLLQEAPFVRAWYHSYAEEYEPVLVTGRGADGALVALMPLALRSRDRSLTHAGAEQAEYHGWIALPEVDVEFPLRVLPELRRAVGFRTWRWRWAPPGTPLDWTQDQALGRAGLHAVVERRPAPVWDLRDGQKLDKLLESRSLRSKINRYKRSGGFRFERIRDVERTRALLEELGRQCDFRQEVVNGVRPFATDPRKAEFLARRQADPESVHFSVLWNGERPLAFHLGGCDGSTCLLGLSSYAPSEARNSPGTLLLIELARALQAEGYQRLDLTPGTDPYKQRFANSENTLARLTLHGSRGAAVRARTGVALRQVVQRASAAQDLAVQERLARWQRSLRAARREWLGAGAGGVLGALRRRAAVRARRICAIRSTALPCATPGPEWDVRRQEWSDLQLAEAASDGLTRRERLAQASERFAAGQVLYSVRAGGELRLRAWRTLVSGEESGRSLAEAGLAQAGSPFLHGFVWGDHGPDVEALRACLAGMLQDLEPGPGGEVVLCLEDGHRRVLEAARGAGFEPVGFVRRAGVPGRVRWRASGASRLVSGAAP